MIATNTTIARDRVQGLPHSEQAGGLLGPAAHRAGNRGRRPSWRALKGTLPIIGVGGIMTGADAVEKMQAGASLVQVYTGFIYCGPGHRRRLRRRRCGR